MWIHNSCPGCVNVVKLYQTCKQQILCHRNIQNWIISRQPYISLSSFRCSDIYQSKQQNMNVRRRKHISVLDQETQFGPIWQKEKVDNCDLIVALSVISDQTLKIFKFITYCCSNVSIHFYPLRYQCFKKNQAWKLCFPCTRKKQNKYIYVKRKNYYVTV